MTPSCGAAKRRCGSLACMLPRRGSLIYFACCQPLLPASSTTTASGAGRWLVIPHPATHCRSAAWRLAPALCQRWRGMPPLLPPLPPLPCIPLLAVLPSPCLPTCPPAWSPARAQADEEEELRKSSTNMTAADAIKRILLAAKDKDYFRQGLHGSTPFRMHVVFAAQGGVLWEGFALKFGFGV